MVWIAFFAFLFGLIVFGVASKDRGWSQKKVGAGSLITGLVMVALALLLVGPPKPPPPPLTAAEQRAALVLDQFNQWDGSHRNLEARVKAALNDPGSYEHIETKYQDRGEYVFLRMKFRGANLFGGKVVSEVMSTADVDGKLLTVEMVEP